jgi:hypothetical protein
VQSQEVSMMEIPREDPAARALRGRLSDFLTEMARAEMDLPHVVYSKDAQGTMASFSGPYPTAIEACVAADIEHQIDLECDGAPTLTFHVAPLYPALAAPGVTPGADEG